MVMKILDESDVEGEWRGQPVYGEAVAALASTKDLTADAAEIQAIRFQAVYRPVLGSYLSLAGASQVGDTVFALKSVEGDAVVGMACVTFDNAGRGAFIIKGLLDKGSPDRLLLENGELSIEVGLGLQDPDNKLPMFWDPTDGNTTVMPSLVSANAVRLVRGGSQYTEMQIVPMSWDFT